MDILFYEKPHCAGNARQRRLLEAAGHRVTVRSLLTEAWTADSLRGFLAARPVAEWFNPGARRVKSGEIAPDRLDADSAMTLLLADPLLVRRPLIEAGGRRDCGFDPDRLAGWIALPDDTCLTGVEACRHGEAQTVCRGRETAA